VGHKGMQDTVCHHDYEVDDKNRNKDPASLHDHVWD
jgi:hypothetical protein